MARSYSLTARDQLARVIRDGADDLRLRAVGVDAARHLDDVLVVEERQGAAVGDVERDDRALVLDDRADGDQRDAVVAGELGPVGLDARRGRCRSRAACSWQSRAAR